MAGVGALVVSSEARADRLGSARDQPMVEVSHAVTVQIDHGVARYIVRRTFANAGVQAEEASLRLDLAHGAAITGLRIRARERWFDGVLMKADEAREKYRELTGVGAWEPKDPALLQWVWADEAHLQVFPVLPGAVSTVEYTLTAPLKYQDGRYVLSYPRSAEEGDNGSLPLATPVLTVEPGYGDAMTQIRVADRLVAPGAPVVLAAPVAPPWVGDGEPAPGAGYVHSAIAVTRDEEVATAKVALEIDHTYAGDLEVELVTPAGERLPVTRGTGSENDLRGEFTIELAPQARSGGTWTLAVSDHAGLDVGTLDAWSLALQPRAKGAKAIAEAARGLPSFIPDARDEDGSGGHALIEIAAPRIDTIAARLGRVVASRERGFSRFEVDAAPQLGVVPRSASVVFVIDVSRSVEAEGIEDQLRLAGAYLAHVPDAQVEVVVFDRAARRLFEALVPAGQFEARVAEARAAGRLHGGNGSAFESGLELAAQVLRGQKGPLRLVAMTDAALRGRFREEMAHASLAGAPRAAIAHVVVPGSEGGSSIERDDTHALAKIAAGHRGVLFRGSVAADDKREVQVAAVLGLVRPIAIDDFAVEGLDVEKDMSEGTCYNRSSGCAGPPSSLREGAGYRASLLLRDPPTRVVVTGKIWAEKLRRVVTSERRFNVATAAFVFSGDDHHDLSEAEMLTVAFMGRAVSPVTSYLATEPGVRPSTEGIERTGIGLGGMGLVGRGGGGAGMGAGSPPALARLLRPGVRRCVAALAPPAGWTVGLEIETTRHEIVDVQVTQSAEPKLTHCLVEAVWATRLPSGAAWPGRETHAITLR